MICNIRNYVCDDMLRSLHKQSFLIVIAADSLRILHTNILYFQEQSRTVWKRYHYHPKYRWLSMATSADAVRKNERFRFVRSKPDSECTRFCPIKFSASLTGSPKRCGIYSLAGLYLYGTFDRIPDSFSNTRRKKL